MKRLFLIAGLLLAPMVTKAEQQIWAFPSPSSEPVDLAKIRVFLKHGWKIIHMECGNSSEYRHTLYIVLESPDETSQTSQSSN
jgi:hypothetical protein